MNEPPTDPRRPSPGKPDLDVPASDDDVTWPYRPQTPSAYRPGASARSGNQGAHSGPASPTGAGRTRPSFPQRTTRPPGSQAGYVAPAQAGRTQHTTPDPARPTPRRQPASRGRRINPGVWLLRGVILAVGAVALLSLLGITAAVAGYLYIASELPRPEELQSQAFTFASSQIYDRDGNLLWELIDPSAGRRTWVPLSRISPYVQQSTIATEDRFFYQNVGVDPIAIGRAFYYNVTEGQVVSGASTITQQLARITLLSPEERTEQSLSRKVREAVLATELFRRYPKDKILEIYLNQIYYGNLAYGIEAASQTYFGKSATDLTLAEAALLAGLPQSPAVYDPFVNPDVAKARQGVVLNLMVEAGYITSAQAEDAYQEELAYIQPQVAFAAPHFVTYVRQLLEARYGPAMLYQEPGIRVHMTLDPHIQAIAEEEVTRQIEALRGKNATNGAVVVLNVKTGEILAMVGSEDFNDETIDGQVNVALRPRQPGSAIKPLTYLAAFERGWTPSTLIMDVPLEYPDGTGGIYKPVNYDNKFHGPVLLRGALANSYNIPAIKALEFVGIPALKEMAARLGITTLTRDDYGLSLALGSGEVTLLELSGAYQAMANGGLRVPPVAVLRVTDSFGRVIEEYRPPEGDPVLRPEHAYLITHILADNQARASAFGPDSPLYLSRPAAAKTGTTNDFRDNWTIGYTPDIVVGVWVGNADNTPMQGVAGIRGAGPIWHNVMERALEGTPARDFIRPPTIVEMEICADSGTIPSEVCPRRATEIFAQDQPPLGPEHDIHQMVRIDTGLKCIAHEYSPPNRVVERYYQVYPPDGRAWAVEHGIEQPPEPCPESAGAAQALITWPADGQTVEGVITIQGVALAANFSHYVVEYGVSWGPQAFGPVAGPTHQLVEGGPLAEWDTREQPNGPYTLRVVVYDQSGGAYEARVVVLVDNPLPSRPTDTPLPPGAPTPQPPMPEPPPTAELPPVHERPKPLPTPPDLNR